MATTDQAVIYPALRYNDAAAAVQWLCAAFGFTEGLVVPGPDGTIGHAELRLGSGVIMVGSADPAQGPRQRADGARASLALYVYVPDLARHYAQAQGAGATITAEPYTTDYGSQEYDALDLEGHQWSFGTYRPT